MHYIMAAVCTVECHFVEPVLAASNGDDAPLLILRRLHREEPKNFPFFNCCLLRFKDYVRRLKVNFTIHEVEIKVSPLPLILKKESYDKEVHFEEATIYRISFINTNIVYLKFIWLA